MTSSDRYRIIARDKYGKELGHMTKDYFNELIGSAMLEHYPSVASFTIERLPPEEAEPHKIWANRYPTHYGSIYQTKERANEEAGNGRTACVQFIEAKITDAMVERATKTCRETHAGSLEEKMRAALAAAWGIEP